MKSCKNSVPDAIHNGLDIISKVMIIVVNVHPAIGAIYSVVIHVIAYWHH